MHGGDFHHAADQQGQMQSDHHRIVTGADLDAAARPAPRQIALCQNQFGQALDADRKGEPDTTSWGRSLPLHENEF